MKLSDFTQEVFENFININEGLVIKKDKILDDMTRIRSMSKDGNIEASVYIPEKFDNDVCIGDLRQFVSVYKNTDDPEFLFDERQLSISGTNFKTEITYAKEREIIHEYDDNHYPKIRNEFVSFSLTHENLAKVLKLCDILQLMEIKIHSENDKIILSAVDRNSPDAKSSHVIVGDMENVENASVVLPLYFPRSIFKFIPLQYNVSLCNGLAIFTNEEHKLEYVITSLT